MIVNSLYSLSREAQWSKDLNSSSFGDAFRRGTLGYVSNEVSRAQQPIVVHLSNTFADPIRAGTMQVQLPDDVRHGYDHLLARMAIPCIGRAEDVFERHLVLPETLKESFTPYELHLQRKGFLPSTNRNRAIFVSDTYQLRKALLELKDKFSGRQIFINPYQSNLKFQQVAHEVGVEVTYSKNTAAIVGVLNHKTKFRDWVEEVDGRVNGSSQPSLREIYARCKIPENIEDIAIIQSSFDAVLQFAKEYHGLISNSGKARYITKPINLLVVQLVDNAAGGQGNFTVQLNPDGTMKISGQSLADPVIVHSETELINWLKQMSKLGPLELAPYYITHKSFSYEIVILDEAICIMGEREQRIKSEDILTSEGTLLDPEIPSQHQLATQQFLFELAKDLHSRGFRDSLGIDGIRIHRSYKNPSPIDLYIEANARRTSPSSLMNVLHMFYSSKLVTNQLAACQVDKVHIPASLDFTSLESVCSRFNVPAATSLNARGWLPITPMVRGNNGHATMVMAFLGTDSKDRQMLEDKFYEATLKSN